MSGYGKDLSIVEEGWYEEGCRMGPMRDHMHLKKFTVEDIFTHAKLSDNKGELVDHKNPVYVV